MKKSRAGCKRKANQMDEEIKADEVLKVEESMKASPTRGKRIKASAPNPNKEQPMEEYFEEKRNMEDLWKSAFPVGTEWDQLDSVYRFNWDFSNLENAFEQGGVLHGEEKVNIFSCTEALIWEEGLILLPVVIAIVSPVFPPSDKIGIKSIQMEAEEIIPMKKMKMDWVPYIPLDYRGNQVERLKNSQKIFILNCTQRRVCLKHLKIERLMKFGYCLPYFNQPLMEEELQQSTMVDIMFPAEPAPFFCQFDWEFDKVDEFVDEKVELWELSDEERDGFKEFVKEKVREARKANREAREAREKAIAEMSEETKLGFEMMRFYKFYPVSSPDTPDVSMYRSPFINRYYGKAHEVF